MPKEHDISKAIDANSDNAADPSELPDAANKELNGHGEDNSSSASEPQEELKSVPTTPDDDSIPTSTEPPVTSEKVNEEQPKLNDDQTMEEPEQAQIQKQAPQDQPPPEALDEPEATQDQLESVAQEDTSVEPQPVAEETPNEDQPEDKVSTDAQAEAGESHEVEAKAKDEAKDEASQADSTGESTGSQLQDDSEAKVEQQPEKTPAQMQIETWEQMDFSILDKSGLVVLMEEMAKADNPIAAEKLSRNLKPFFIKIQKTQKQQALDQFVADGNDPDGFAYRFDELDNRFDAAFKLLRDRRFQRVKDLERDKEKNLQEKTQLLEELRALVEAEETNSSINALKKIQDRWRSLGPVPGQHAKTIWANYHALLDLYYDHRSIYYELKELDRKKNLEAKLELCERAEKLNEQENLKQAINELNELHDEFKHIGPVPKSEQEALWQRFKAASDKIYARRKEFVKHLKEDLKENLVKKSALAEEVQQYVDFNSDRITDWNKKTQALLELQKRWDAIGGLPRDKAKEVNRRFWGAFKGFFQRKGQFFKKLEGERGANLEKKQALVTEAQALKDSTEWEQTAEKLKNLQKQWREIGPVPEKQRNQIYAQFKEACDHFFNNRRAQSAEVEKEYVVNLQKKQDICTQIEALTTAKDYDLDKFRELKAAFDEIGYVPSSEVRNIREQFKGTVQDYLNAAPEDLQEEARQIKYDIEFENLKSGPNANRKKGQKEQALRREIGALENDISTWKNNLEFFAASKTADKLREEFTGKIDAANEKLQDLKRQLRALRQL